MPSSFSQILNITRSGMLSRLLSLDVASNNLANVNTTGFKRSRANFQELLDERLAEGPQPLNGTQISSTESIMDPGAIRKTDNPLDLSIQGQGFFAVTLQDGRTAYTRDGQFFLDGNREIVNASGFKLVWQGQVLAGAEDIHVNPDGSVMILQAGNWSQAGTIQLSRFANPAGLQGYGQNLWIETEVSGAAQAGAANAEGAGMILGNALEGSNVNLSEEMVQLVSLQRSFELSLRTFQQTDQMLSQAIHVRRG